MEEAAEGRRGPLIAASTTGTDYRELEAWTGDTLPGCPAHWLAHSPPGLGWFMGAAGESSTLLSSPTHHTIPPSGGFWTWLHAGPLEVEGTWGHVLYPLGLCGLVWAAPYMAVLKE